MPIIIMGIIQFNYSLVLMNKTHEHHLGMCPVHGVINNDDNNLLPLVDIKHYNNLLLKIQIGGRKISWLHDFLY